MVVLELHSAIVEIYSMNDDGYDYEYDYDII